MVDLSRERFPISHSFASTIQTRLFDWFTSQVLPCGILFYGKR